MDTMIKRFQSERLFWLKIKMDVLRYVLVNAFLALVNWMTSPHYWWVLWVVAGWGLNLLLSIISRYMTHQIRKEKG